MVNVTRRRRPTLDDVAAAVGVSRATVSNAYNRPDQLSAELRERVLEAAKRLGYAGPNPVARSLARSQSGAIAFMLDANLSIAFSDPALSITLDAFATAIAPGEHALVLLPGGEDGGPRVEQVMRAQADLMVSYSLSDKASGLQAVRDRGLPLVVIDEPFMPGAAVVGIDDRGGAEAAARHLVELGHRRIGILAQDCMYGFPGGRRSRAEAERSPFRINRERLAGYLGVLAAAGVDPDSVPIWEFTGMDREKAVAGAHTALTEEPGLTALLCMSDELASAATTAARHLGLRIPEDLSLVGYDDTSTARLLEPPLTTVRQDLISKGRIAGELALRLLSGRKAPKPTKLPTELVVRSSTAPVNAGRKRR
ncbi:DNA-binding transcriptional regulator, LacI/PurR family [Allokutzneria albata]|uniref:DNA-binding transcriptional regulator, LacI/PurR family n=1 Tax=Allokutzneria albata TaxID=211114 RepID=A0A1G9ZAD2_ALLAB|nr:DNA-binding transcriptional regulator, LacI/PurR family [Allokutzneria albata]